MRLGDDLRKFVELLLSKKVDFVIVSLLSGGRFRGPKGRCLGGASRRRRGFWIGGLPCFRRAGAFLAPTWFSNSARRLGHRYVIPTLA